MNSLRVDTAGLRFRVDAVEQQKDLAGNPVLDRETQAPKFRVHLTVRTPDRVRPDQWTVTVVGAPKIAVDQYVTLHAVVALPWEQGDRHGIALRAAGIEPEQAAAASSSTPSSSASASGSPVAVGSRA